MKNRTATVATRRTAAGKWKRPFTGRFAFTARMQFAIEVEGKIAGGIGLVALYGKVRE